MPRTTERGPRRRAWPRSTQPAPKVASPGVPYDSGVDATSELAKLQAARTGARNRVAALEGEARAAGQTLARCREQVAEFERQDDGKPADRQKLEAQLRAAEGEAAKPWAQRIDGARRRVRDHDRAVADHVRANLLEVVAPLEADGAIHAERITELAHQIVAEVAERDAIAQQIGGLLAMIGRVDPGDVSRSNSEDLVIEARRLITGGGEDAPRLLRDPRQPTEARAPEPSDAVTA